MLYAALLMLRWLRAAMMGALSLCATHCSPLPSSAPHLDLSDEQHMLVSLQQMEEALTEDQRIVFEKALHRLVTTLTSQDINRWAETPNAVPTLSLLHLNGLTADEIIAKAMSATP